MDFLATIAPPVVTQPQAFSDAMLDPTSRGLMTSLTTKHMSGATLQRTLRHSADQLQRTVQGQFVSLKVCEIGLTKRGSSYETEPRYRPCSKANPSQVFFRSLQISEIPGDLKKSQSSVVNFAYTDNPCSVYSLHENLHATCKVHVTLFVGEQLNLESKCNLRGITCGISPIWCL